MTDTFRRAAREVAWEETLWTFEDAVEHVCDCFDVGQSDRPLRHAIRAVLTAYRGLPELHRWKRYQRQTTIATVADYSTGTIAYDHTGGSYERLLTLSSGTWPSWAEFGIVEINNVAYEVDQRISDTLLQLDDHNNPGVDVDAGTSYQIYRTRYPLPADYRRSGRVLRADNKVGMYPADLVDAHQEDLYVSTPWQTTISQDHHYAKGLALEFSPPPTSAVSYSFIYERRPQPLLTRRYATGTISVNNSTTVTGSGTAFASAHVGSVLRIGDASDAPTSIVGSRFYTDNAWSYQRTVMAVASATSLTIDAAISENLSGYKYVISDPLDIDNGPMLDAYLRLAELEFARLFNKDAKEMAVRRASFASALAQAQWADRRDTNIRSAGSADVGLIAAWGDIDVTP